MLPSLLAARARTPALVWCALVIGGCTSSGQEETPVPSQADVAPEPEPVPDWIPGEGPFSAVNVIAGETSETLDWAAWQATITPAEVSGYPGDRVEATIDLRRVEPTDVPRLGFEHGPWVFVRGRGMAGDVPPVMPAEGGRVRIVITIPQVLPDPPRAFVGTFMPGKSRPYPNLPKELPGPTLHAKKGRAIARIVPHSKADWSTAPKGLSARVEGREVLVVYSMAGRTDRERQVLGEREFELQELEPSKYLLVGEVRTWSSDDVVVPDQPSNPRVEARLTLPTAGELRVVVLRAASRRGPAGVWSPDPH